MSDIDDRTEKRSALDAFAAAPARELVQAPSVMPMASPGDRVFGAQNVAVYRDEARILQKLSALGAAAGDDWFYRFPVRKKIKDDDGKDQWVKDWIEGPSIKLANDVSRIYGNCEVDTRVIDMGASWLIYARFTDFETGYALTRPFQQDKGGSKMGGKGAEADARRLDIAFQIGVSKAIRNVVTNALQTFSDHAFSAARNSLVDKIGKDIAKWQKEILVRLKDRGIDQQRVELVLGRASADWTAPDVAKIIAMMKAVADGMATIDETFPPRPGTEHVDAETGEVTEQTNSAAGHTPSGAAEAGPTHSKQVTVSDSDKAGPANDTEASKQPTASNQTGPAATGQAASSASAPDPSKADTGKGAATPAKTPATEAEYIAHADAWRVELLDADELEKRWKDEKSIRNKANVGSEARESLQEKLAARCAEIRDADRS